MTVPLAIAVPVYLKAKELYDYRNDPIQVKYRSVGVDNAGRLNFSQLMANWMPLIAGVVVHKAANSSTIGINRMLANAKIPLIRI